MGVGLVQDPSRANAMILMHSGRVPKIPLHRMIKKKKKCRGGGSTILNKVVRMGLTKKVTFEQRPKEALRARKPCVYLREEMPGSRQARATCLRPEKGQ